jgi:hypothetical protein
MRPARTHPFTLQYVSGHDNIKTTMDYVNPRGLADLQRQKVAEVVELADTPS